MKVPFSDVIALVRQIAGEEADSTATCSYFSGPDPVCLIGRVFVWFGIHPLLAGLSVLSGGYPESAGVNQGTLLTKDGAYFCPPNAQVGMIGDDAWVRANIEPPTNFQRQWIHHVQLSQDNGKPWGDAVAIADEEIGVM